MNTTQEVLRVSIEMLRIYGWLSGSDGNGTPPPVEPQKGQAPNPDGQVPPAGDDGDDDGDGGGDGASGANALSAEAASKLRRENQELRRRAKEAEAKAAEFEKAQMTELERAKAERDEARAEAEAIKNGTRQARLEAAVLSKASAFIDPAEAFALLDLDEIVIDDNGKPDGRSVAAAIAKLAKAKPHLLKPGGSGDGDGAPRTPATPTTAATRVQAHEKRLLEGGGMVRMPGR